MEPDADNDLSERLRNFRFRLAEIDVVKNFNNPDVSRDSVSSGGVMNYSLSFSFSVNIDENSITVMVLFAMNHELAGKEVKVIDTKIKNRYEIPDLKSLLKPGTDPKSWELPDSMGRMLANESLAHSRGIQAYLLRGTPLDGYYMPFADPDEFIDKSEES